MVLCSVSNGSRQEPLPTRAETGRRGFLRGLAALLPLTAVAAQIVPAPAAANPAAECPALLELGAVMEAQETKLIDAVVAREAARARCRAMWPEVPEEIVYRRSQHDHLDYRREENEDGKTAYTRGDRLPARLLITAYSVQDFLDGADRRLRIVKQTMPLRPIVERYEAAREHAREASGFAEAKSIASGVAYKVDELSELISKCECHTFAGLALKARALQIAVLAGCEVDQHIALRARVLHAEIIARDIISLRGAA